jgi:hypothetical protein
VSPPKLVLMVFSVDTVNIKEAKCLSVTWIVERMEFVVSVKPTLTVLVTRISRESNVKFQSQPAKMELYATTALHVCGKKMALLAAIVR